MTKTTDILDDKYIELLNTLTIKHDTKSNEYETLLTKYDNILIENKNLKMVIEKCGTHNNEKIHQYI